MKYIRLAIIIAAAIACATACKKDESYGITFEQTGYYFNWGDAPKSGRFVTENIASASVGTVTEGWKFELDMSGGSFTITPPAEPESDQEREDMRTGTAVINAVSRKGSAVRYVIDFYIIDDGSVMFNAGGAGYANCYVASVPGALYTFDGRVCGNGPSPSISPVRANVVWQSRSGMIQHIYLEPSTGEVSFYIDRATDDKGKFITDSQGRYVVPEGNAVVAVLDGADNILWSWHIWVIPAESGPFDGEVEYAGGKIFMNKNLGSFANSNGATDDDELILRSYGLYYQWGRKDPFARPYYYNCAGGQEERLYTASGSIAYVQPVECDAATGTTEYARMHPLEMVINPASVADDGDGVGDWLYTADNNLWRDDVKTDNDPCPYGWRVPAKGDFAALSLDAAEDAREDLDELRRQYGWMLSCGSGTTFYNACGLRTYYDGTVVNMNYKEADVYPSTPEPWEGYYWTSGKSADGKQSTCLYFDLTTTRAVNKFHLDYPSRRANAMQVRCVKL